jgi:predicted DNA-binding protein
MSEPGFDLDKTDLRPYIQQARPDLLPRPAPDAGPKIAVPVRLSPDVIESLKQLAQQRGIGYTTLMAQIIESAVAEMTVDDQAMVPLADVRRAIAQLARRAASPAA